MSHLTKILERMMIRPIIWQTMVYQTKNAHENKIGRREFTHILHEKINSGELVQNGKLFPERKIAQIMRVSRPILRQAIAVLEAFGVLEIRERGGVYVQKHNLKNLPEVSLLFSDWPIDVFPQLFEMRNILEPRAARLAALRRTAGDLAKMQEAIRQMSEFGTSNLNYEGYAAWNKVFHSMLVRATQNQVFVRISECILFAYEQTVVVLGKNSFDGSQVMWPSEAVEEHNDIFCAIEMRDEDKAEENAVKHLDRANFRIKTLASKFNVRMC